MVKKAYLPLYVRDFLSDPVVLGMTFTEQSVYLRMLMLSWEHGPLERDVARLARMVGIVGDVVHESEPRAVENVLERAWEEGPEGWTNPRLERERQRFANMRARASENGKKGNERRWPSPGVAESSPPDRGTVAEPSRGGRILQAQAQEEEQSRTASLRSAGADAAAPRRRKPSRPRKPADGPQAETIRTWERLWGEARAEPFAWSDREAASIAACRKLAKDDLALFEARARRLLFDPPDKWYAQNASPSTLAARWNQLAVHVAERAETVLQRQKREGLERMIAACEGSGA